MRQAASNLFALLALSHALSTPKELHRFLFLIHLPTVKVSHMYNSHATTFVLRVSRLPLPYMHCIQVAP